jgi:Trk K+ transport system NAD-binding subunit
MELLSAIILILGVFLIYLIVIELYTILFRMTGLTKEKSKFQVISMITTAGFTTSESEIITSSKVRRRIAVAAMITGTLFSVVIISLIINLFTKIQNSSNSAEHVVWIGVAFGVFIVLLILFKLPITTKLFEKLVEFVANTFFHVNSNNNVITQLDVYGDDAIEEVTINIVPDELVGKTLAESNLKARYHLNILMVQRNKRTININRDTVIQKKDVLLVFGPKKLIERFFDQTQGVQKEDDMSIKNTITVIDNYGDDAMTEIEVNIVPDELLNTPLINSGLKRIYDLNVLTIKRGDISIKVDKDTVILEKDIVVVFGDYKNMEEVFVNKVNARVEQKN